MVGICLKGVFFQATSGILEVKLVELVEQLGYEIIRTLSFPRAVM